MSNYYKIEGENEFAYFRANLSQLRKVFESDPNWAGNVMEIFGHFGITKGMQKFRNSLFGCKVEEMGGNYFAVRGTLDFCYRVEALNKDVSRIIPVGKLPTALKITIPFELALICIFPIIFTPLVYKVRRLKIENWSKAHLPALCQYLEMRGKEIYRQQPTGEIGQ